MGAFENMKLEERLISEIAEKQQVSFNDLYSALHEDGVTSEELEKSLSTLEKSGVIASRSTGGIMTYYSLDSNPIKKVLIVEDDRDINKLMALSIGEGFDIHQIYDGGEVIDYVKKNKPALIILDLMLPNRDGLSICQEIKENPELRNTIIILVSAMDPTSNRLQGIKYGADYYIKKPFEPKELRTLVTIFLKKKGRPFDPLIDLPDEARISKEFEYSIKAGNEYSIGTLSINGLSDYAQRFGEKSAIVLLRLVSQLLQDSIKKYGQKVFAGFLNSSKFVVAGSKKELTDSIQEVKKEFNAVLPFIMQDAGFKQLPGIEPIFDMAEAPKLSIVFTESNKDDRISRRNEVLKNKGIAADNIGSYSYEELQKMFGDDNLDIQITRDANGVKLNIGKKRS
ncbi:MAG: response regulator [Candidatus Micrarchaeaceae archaeon]